MKKLLLLLIIFVGGYALAQAVSPTSPVVVAPAVVEPSGLSGFFAAHGGVMAVAIAAMLMLNTVLSAVRDLLYKFDGIAPGAVVPAQYAGLTKLNIVCVWLGKILDYVQGNVAH